MRAWQIIQDDARDSFIYQRPVKDGRAGVAGAVKIYLAVPRFFQPGQVVQEDADVVEGHHGRGHAGQGHEAEGVVLHPGKTSARGKKDGQGCRRAVSCQARLEAPVDDRFRVNVAGHAAHGVHGELPLAPDPYNDFLPGAGINDHLQPDIHPINLTAVDPE